jgi:hypothetical protein
LFFLKVQNALFSNYILLRNDISTRKGLTTLKQNKKRPFGRFNKPPLLIPSVIVFKRFLKEFNI